MTKCLIEHEKCEHYVPCKCDGRCDACIYETDNEECLFTGEDKQTLERKVYCLQLELDAEKRCRRIDNEYLLARAVKAEERLKNL